MEEFRPKQADDGAAGVAEDRGVIQASDRVRKWRELREAWVGLCMCVKECVYIVGVYTHTHRYADLLAAGNHGNRHTGMSPEC